MTSSSKSSDAEQRSRSLADGERARICAIRNREHALQIHDSDPEAAFQWMRHAHAQEAQAVAALALTEAPTIGLGGDFLPTEASVGAYAVNLLKSENVNALHTEAACDRIGLASEANALELSADAAEAAKASDSIEVMLAHQAAAFHKHAMKYLARADGVSDPIERCRLANTATRLASVSQDAVLSLARKRAGGRQTVVVQHVSVNQGAQAMIGSVSRGSSANRGGEGAEIWVIPCVRHARRWTCTRAAALIVGRPTSRADHRR